MPKVIDFLGYEPAKRNATTLGERIKQYRIQQGLSLRRLAKEFGIDPGTLSRWERNECGSHGKIKEIFNEIIV